MNSHQLNGKTALITGASRGIGAAIAKALAGAGARVMINYTKQEAAARETLAGLPGKGHSLYRADVSNPKQVRGMVAETARRLGRLDILVNNAGIFENQPFTMDDYAAWQDSWKRVLDTNLMSAANATWCAVQQMQANGGGKIINIASRSAFRAETEAPAYAVSKAGMVNLTRCLARALAEENILAYCIAPGWVETSMARNSMETILPEILAQIPLGRVASVEDVANVTLFLATDAANYLTGITIPVAGGSWMTT